MTHKLSFLALLVLLGFLAISPEASGQVPGRFSWKYSTAGTDQIPGNADDDPPCTATLVNDCVSGFRLLYRRANGTEGVGIQFVSVSTGCTLDSGSTSSYTCFANMPSVLTGVGRYEKLTWVVKAIALDSLGVEVLAEDSNTVEVPRRPRPAVGLVVE